MKPRSQTAAAHAGFVGKEDRYDAIVGYDGYSCGERGGRLRVYLHYRSAKGVNKAYARIQTLERVLYGFPWQILGTYART